MTEDIKKPLETTWKMGEPNIASAHRKNDEGLCAFHTCENTFSDPPETVGWGGLKICDGCNTKIDKTMNDVNKELDRTRLEQLSLYFKEPEES